MTHERTVVEIWWLYFIRICWTFSSFEDRFRQQRSAHSTATGKLFHQAHILHINTVSLINHLIKASLCSSSVSKTRPKMIYQKNIHSSVSLKKKKRPLCFLEDIPFHHCSFSSLVLCVSLVHSATLFLNLLACLAYFSVDTSRGVDFGLSILWFVLFTPVSFICWYRPVYKAFRYRTLFNYTCSSW